MPQHRFSSPELPDDVLLLPPSLQEKLLAQPDDHQAAMVVDHPQVHLIWKNGLLLDIPKVNLRRDHFISVSPSIS
jgi:hypothetical protein